MKKGLILEGGAMRGMFTCGVTDVMLEQGIAYDGAIGVSAGACFGCNYKSKQAGRAIRYNKKYSRDPRYAGMRSLIKTGDYYGADFCYRELPEELDLFDVATYRSNPMEFYVVATDVRSGKAIYHRCDLGNGEDLQWFRASASMPLVSRIVHADGYELLDGGIADSIPLQAFQQMGYEKNVVVLTQPRNFVKQKNKAMPIMRLVLGKYPNLLRTMEQRHEDYNRTLEYIRSEEAKGNTFVISPDAPLEIERTEKDPAKLQAVYDLGRNAMLRRMEELKDFLK